MAQKENQAPEAMEMQETAEDAGEGGIEDTTVPYRQNFAETAFFYPQLQTDTDGIVKINFTMPESTTRWKFMALAYTRQLAHGKLTEYITTSRELMVRPNMPRFLRSGDKAELKVTVSNLSQVQQTGKVTLELFTPQNEKIIVSRKADFNLSAGTENFFILRGEQFKQSVLHSTFHRGSIWQAAGLLPLAEHIVMESSNYSRFYPIGFW